MDEQKTLKIVEGLNDKALDAESATDALKYSQAASNVANSFACMSDAKRHNSTD